ncbi:MAG: EAL domain-containing protein [Sulfuricurvum sp.]|uniref:EAL domain-containing protein n=1 Tax=Sulfuricurvum sp. TaxID=2025608 RepID=UPI002626FE43|nr:EAL domain-containing protein [Sulfuricurvum sp.]MDD2829216.1 EAL domain-containing protein [Sulfuricurvum sp.]MDD4949049.1 EAL domain-containing protein [Sulfuricurvum sp.]
MGVKILLLLTISVTFLFSSQQVNIGVLAFHSKADTLKEWEPVVSYLQQSEPNYTFRILPLNYPEINNAVKNRTLDFIITNSGHYIILEKQYHISRIATMMRYQNTQWVDRFGGVIFTRSDRTDINTLQDLKDKKIAAVDQESLGGYAAQLYELFRNHITKNELKLHFTGMPHTNVVESVLSGKMDVGFVRTNVLEDMAHAGKLDLHKLKIIHPLYQKGFPYHLSTTLYPEWPIAQMRHTDKILSNKVVVALLKRTELHNGEIGWTAPLEYRDIHEMFQTLRLPPYDTPERFNIRDVYNQYKIFIWLLTTLSVIIFIGIFIEILLRKQLFIESQKNKAFLQFSADGVHILDLSGNIILVNDRFCEMLGYTHDEMMGMNISHWEAIFSLKRVQSLSKKLPPEGEIVQTKHRRKDGSIYDAEISVNKIKVGNNIWIYCSARDITERLYHQTQIELAALVYENSSDAILISDAYNHIISVNPAFETLSGYHLKEIEGKITTLLKSDHHQLGFYHQMWNALTITGKWEGEIVDKNKNDELFSKWLSIRTIFDYSGNPYRRIAIFSEITDQKEAKHKLWYQANFDSLTGLLNRQMFQYRLDKELEEIQRRNRSIALLFLDIDHFKDINDTLGHDKGDILLKEVANRITHCLRKNDIIGRFGGDEFTIILLNIESILMIETIASELLIELSHEFELDGEPFYISASIGITIAPEDSLKSETLLMNADQAMYAAKKEGRNRFKFYTSDMQEIIQKRMTIVHDLREAIVQQQFVLYYQPILDLHSGKVHKAEALIRWIKPDGTMINPADFIPITEETGCIVQIGDWIFEEAIRQVQTWRNLFCPNFQISVNKSPVQFLHDGDHSKLINLMEKNNLSFDAIVVEITEGILMEKTTLVQEKLHEFESKGVAVSLDDFGTGFSSLSYLKKFDIDYLKIDQSFVRNVVTDHNDQVLCEAIVAMSHKMGIKVIAEGVETVEQRKYLHSIECDYMQGYLISRPIPPKEFEEKFFGLN